MNCNHCHHEERGVCKIYNLPVDEFDVMEYCPHKKVDTDEEWHNKMLLPSKPIRRLK